MRKYPLPVARPTSQPAHEAKRGEYTNNYTTRRGRKGIIDSAMTMHSGSNKNSTASSASQTQADAPWRQCTSDCYLPRHSGTAT